MCSQKIPRDYRIEREITMKQIKEIHSIITSTSITFYWDKPSTFRASDSYQIFLNGIQLGETAKTHYTLKNLTPDTPYHIKLIWLQNGKNSAQYEWDTKTDIEKKRLDITLPPYNAVGDGKTINTKAIQRAVDDCTSSQTVYIPEGIFLTGALRLHSSMELYLAKNAVLQGTEFPKDYLPKIKSRFEGTEMMCYSSLLNLGELDHNGGYNCHDVVIHGEGTIAGGGRTLSDNIIALESESMRGYLESLGDQILEYEKPETIPGRARSRLINMSNCQNITLSGLTLKDGASWNVHMIYSDHITTNHCSFHSRNIWNGDGWDSDSSANCTIFDCTFYTGDDSIAVKSGKNPEGNEISRPCKDIRIFDCRCAFGHGLTIGSEISGGIENIYIWDCDMTHSSCGIEIKGTKKRGGYVRNVIVRDCTAARIQFHCVSYNDDGIAAPVPPIFESCRFDHIHILGEYLNDDENWITCQPLELCGFDREGYELAQIEFNHLILGRHGCSNEQTISLQCVKGITFRDICTA